MPPQIILTDDISGTLYLYLTVRVLLMSNKSMNEFYKWQNTEQIRIELANDWRVTISPNGVAIPPASNPI